MLTRGAAKLQRQSALSLTPTPPCPLNNSLNIPFLPFELIDIIIGYLQENRLALKACCLVSRQWLACARQHLHHTAVLGSTRDYARWKYLMQSCSAIRSQYLRRVELVPTEAGLNGFFYARTRYPSLGVLPNVRSLKWDMSVYNGRDGALVEFVKSVPAVKHLDVLGKFLHLFDMVASLSLFKGLKSLCIKSALVHELSRTRSREDMHFDAESLEALDALCANAPIYTMIALWINPKKLRRLRLSLRTLREVVKCASKMISDSANTLEALTVEVIVPRGSIIDTLPIMNETLPNLRQMYFCISECHHHCHHDHRHYLDLIRRLMVHMPIASRVTRVHLWFGNAFDRDTLNTLVFKDREAWNELVFPRLMQTFPNVKIVEIRIMTRFQVEPHEIQTMVDGLRLQVWLPGVPLSVPIDHRLSELRTGSYLD